MTEKERELRQQIKSKTEEIQGLANQGKLDDAEALVPALRNMKRELDLLVELNDTKDIVPEAARGGGAKDEVIDSEIATRAFAKLIRGQRLNEEEQRAQKLVEGTPADGGYIVPVDGQTAINELKRALNPLEQFVSVENVITMTGTRVYEDNASLVPFAKVSEMGNIADMANPTFKQISYTIQRYAGILPISKQLLADTDQNLLNYVYQWFAKKDVVTRNTEILKILNTLSKTAIANIDAVKDIVNVTLDPMIALSSSVVTNQDGFNFLDKMKDTEGRHLLQPNPLDPTRKMLLGMDVHVLSNTHLQTDSSSGKKAPVIIGSLTDAVKLFDRQQNSIEGTAVGGQAFLRDSFDIKGITRFDVKLLDDKAAVMGQITIA